MQIVFHTPRLLLRQFTEDDAALILSLNSNPEVVRYLHEPTLKTEDDALHVLQTIILPQYINKLGRWAMHIKENNEFIGWCGLKHRSELDEIDLGYRLIQSAWGNGFATEAALHSLEYGFKSLLLTKITGRAHVENWASIKILEKLGMTFIGQGIVDDCPVRTYQITNPSL